MILDCTGRPCPVPVIELARALPTVAVGDVIEVLSDDPAAAVDIPAWCRMRDQAYEGPGAAGASGLPAGSAGGAGSAEVPSYRVRRLH